jgi:tRNA threonylcarbamoyl adenosine modification protein YeaZ
MFNLFIDTTQQYCMLAILRDKKLLHKIQMHTHNNLTDVVVEHVSKLLNLSKIKLNQIKNIYVAIGPGSFTGVRVATTVVKAIALVHKVNIYTIDSLLLQMPQKHGVSVLDARGNHYFVSVHKNNKCVVKPTMVPDHKLQQFTKKYHTLPVYSLYNHINIFDNLVHHYQDFKLIANIDTLTPLYIKKAV